MRHKNQNSHPRNSPADLVGSSPQIRKVLALIQEYGPSSRPVLITGQTGTGKGVVARRLHEAVRGAGKKPLPFVALNCAGLQDTLGGSDLFGHKQGAYTSAGEARQGAIEQAGAGTLFLDEVGDLAPVLQGKLLQLLDEGTYQRLGCDQVRTTRARVIAATHRNLERMVERGEFREDLYHRLSVLTIELPPLSARLSDLPELARHFLAGLAEPEGLPAPEPSQALLDLLAGRSWPGNVRGLKHFLEQLWVQQRRALIEGRPLEPVTRSPVTDLPLDSSPSIWPTFRDLDEECKRKKQEVARAVFEEEGRKITRAAKRLGVPRSTLVKYLADEVARRSNR